MKSASIRLCLPPVYPARCSTDRVRTICLKRLLQHCEGLLTSVNSAQPI